MCSKAWLAASEERRRRERLARDAHVRMHVLKGLACHARVTPASSPASARTATFEAVLSAHVAFAPRARLR